MSDLVPPNDGGLQAGRTEIPRMSLEVARAKMQEYINMSLDQFTDLKSMEGFNGFIDVLTIIATDVLETSDRVIATNANLSDSFQTTRVEGNQKFGLNLKYPERVVQLLFCARDKNQRIRILRQNTPTEITIETEDIPNNSGFKSFVFSFELQSPFPEQRPNRMFVNFIKENGGPNGGVYYPPLLDKEMKLEYFQTIARGAI